MPLNDSRTLYSLLDQHNSALKILLKQQKNDNNTIKSLSSNTINNNGITSLSNKVSSKANQNDVSNSFSSVNTSLSTLNQNTETKDLANSAHNSLSSQVNSLNYANSELNTAIGPNAGSQISSLASQVNNFDNTTQKSLNSKISSNTDDINTINQNEINNLNEAHSYTDHKTNDVTSELNLLNTDVQEQLIPNATNAAVSQANSYTNQHADNTALQSAVDVNSNNIQNNTNILSGKIEQLNQNTDDLNNNKVTDNHDGTITVNGESYTPVDKNNVYSRISHMSSTTKEYVDYKLQNMQSSQSQAPNPYKATLLEENPDMNNLTNPGSYSLSAIYDLGGLTNGPSAINFTAAIIEIYEISSTNNNMNGRMQKVTCKNGIFMRFGTYENNNWNWNPWTTVFSSYN